MSPDSLERTPFHSDMPYGFYVKTRPYVKLNKSGVLNKCLVGRSSGLRDNRGRPSFRASLPEPARPLLLQSPDSSTAT